MEHLRRHMPRQIHGADVVAVDDYLSSHQDVAANGKTEKIELPKSNVLSFWLADKTKIVVRPSGTEPKVKLYCGVHAPVQGSIEATEKNSRKKTESPNTTKELINA